MSVVPMRNEWPDSRLNDLKRTVDRMVPTVETVRVLEERMDGIIRELQANTKATEHVSKQLARTEIEPLHRVRKFRQEALVALMSAFVAGSLAVVSTLAASGVFH